MEITTAALLSRASPAQFSHLLSLYPSALKLKAESKSKKPQELIKLDDWMENELPLKIRARAPDHHLLHEELVNCMRWKLARGKFRPRLKELVTMNSPRVVQQESRKAFRALFKKDDLASAINYLCNLKGIGPATASALLRAAAPEKAAFMADECLQAVPEIEGIDYTVQEYLEMMRAVGQARAKLGETWTPHKIELVLWTHNVLLAQKPEMLAGVPEAEGRRQVAVVGENGEGKEEEHEHHPRADEDSYPGQGEEENGYEAHQQPTHEGTTVEQQPPPFTHDGEPAAFDDEHPDEHVQPRAFAHEELQELGQQEPVFGQEPTPHPPPNLLSLIDDSSTSSSLVIYDGGEDSADGSREQAVPAPTTTEENSSSSLDGFAAAYKEDGGGGPAPKKIKIL